jgi:hypothetical protein
MADFVYKGTLDGSEPAEFDFAVAAGAAGSIEEGDIVVIADGYASKATNGSFTASNILGGLAKQTSTDTASADGICKCQFSPAGLIVEGTATTPANLTTAVRYDKVTLDVAAGVQKVDENDAGALLVWKYPTSTPTTDGKVQIVVPFNLAS